jgi:hypothetical protein
MQGLGSELQEVILSPWSTVSGKISLTLRTLPSWILSAQTLDQKRKWDLYKVKINGSEIGDSEGTLPKRCDPGDVPWVDGSDSGCVLLFSGQVLSDSWNHSMGSPEGNNAEWHLQPAAMEEEFTASAYPVANQQQEYPGTNQDSQRASSGSKGSCYPHMTILL